jgi:hypothetical protein
MVSDFKNLLGVLLMCKYYVYTWLVITRFANCSCEMGIVLRQVHCTLLLVHVSEG